MRLWPRLLPAFFILSTFSSCVYYNTFYNAKKQFELATIRRLESDAEPENRMLANSYLDYYLSAIRKSSTVLELHSESKWVDDSLLLIGKSYYWRSEYKDSLLKFDELLQNFPESELRSETLYWRAIALWGNEEFLESRELLEQIGKSDDSIYAWQARLALAELEQAQENYDVAIRNYLSLVDDLDNEDLRTRLWKGIGDTYFSQKNYPNALNAYRMVLRSKPDDLTRYQTQTKIGAVQELTDDLEGAMATYSQLERAKRFKHYQPKVRLKIANVYRLTGDTDGSLAAYKKIITDNPLTQESAESYYQIALIEYQVRRNNEAAMELLAKARKERSTSEAAVKARELERTLFQLDKFKKKAEKDNKQGNEALFSIAEIYLFSLGEVDSALRSYERILARPDNNILTAKALYGMALIYADSLDNQEESNRLFQKLIADYPVTPYAIDARERTNEDRSDDILAEARYIEAEVLKDKGADPQRVLTILNQVTEEFPASLYAPKALFAMAWTYENDLDNPDVAAKQYERLVKTYPQTDFAEISKDKIKSIKKEQRDLQKKLAKEKKDTEKPEAASIEEKGERPGDKPKIPDKSEEEKPPQSAESGSYEAKSKDNKGDKPTPKQVKVGQESAQKLKDGPLDASEIDQLPALVQAPPPEYREELNEEEGVDPNVSVRMLVDKDGKITRVIVLEGNELLREAAVDLAFQYRFEPGIHKGKPREVWMEFPITFLNPYSEEEGEPQ